MTDIQAFEAWAKDKPLEVFWSWEAWKAATQAERKRCEDLVLDLPMKQSGMYWNDHCKSFAFYAATCIKAPEIFDQDFNVHTPEDKP